MEQRQACTGEQPGRYACAGSATSPDEVVAAWQRWWHKRLDAATTLHDAQARQRLLQFGQWPRVVVDTVFLVLIGLILNVVLGVVAIL